MNTPKASLALIACLAGPAGHADTAVSRTNVQVQASYGSTEFDSAYEDLDSTAGHVALQIPIVGVLGASVEGVIGRVEAGSSYEYDYYQYMASLFARSPELGMLGIGIGGSEIKIDPPYLDSSSTDYRAIAAAYLGPVTLAATRSTSDDEDTSGTGNYAWADLTWYVTPNLLLDVTAGLMDAADDYMLALEHQIGQTGFSYGLNYGWNSGSFDSESYYLVVSYRFGAGKSLQDRYRRDLYTAR